MNYGKLLRLRQNSLHLYKILNKSTFFTVVTNPKRPREYSGHLYSTIPIKQLLIETRSNEAAFGHLYPRLLRLLATHYPHLCLVEDWISEEEQLQVASHTATINQRQLRAVEDSVEEFLTNGMCYCVLWPSFLFTLIADHQWKIIFIVRSSNVDCIVLMLYALNHF